MIVKVRALNEHALVDVCGDWTTFPGQAHVNPSGPRHVNSLMCFLYRLSIELIL